MKVRNLFIKIVTVILFSLLILSFAVWGIGDIFRATGPTQAVAEVGDTVVDQQAFANQLSREIGNLNRQLGTQLSTEQVRAFGIPQQVLSQMISRAVLEEKASKMGLLVTERQMQRELLENPAFTGPTGSFDAQRFMMFLRQFNMSEQAYLAQLSEDTKRRQLVTAVVAGAEAPSSMVEQVLAYRDERRVGEYVEIPQAGFEDLGEPDEAALQAVYDEAGSGFMTPEYKSVSLVHLDLAKAAERVTVSDERLRSEFEARKDVLFQPERRAVSQAVLPDQAAAETLAATLAEGVDFASAVEAATGNPPLDLGTVTQSDLPPALAEAAFALEQGQTSAPVQSALGWHILRVAEVEPAQEADFEDYRETLRAEVAEGDAVNTIIDQANRFDEELSAGSTMDQAAGFMNLEVREIPAIDGQGLNPDGEAVADLPALQDFLAVLASLQTGETSTLRETRDGDFFMLRVDGITPAEKRPLDEVRDDVISLWRAQEQARLAEEKATAIAQRVKDGEDFAAVAEAEGLTLQETAPVTRFETDRQQVAHPLLAQQLFEVAEGEVSTAALPGSQVVVRLKEILPPDSEGRDARLTALQTQLTTSLQDEIFQQFLGALQQEYPVTINQRLVDELVQGF